MNGLMRRGSWLPLMLLCSLLGCDAGRFGKDASPYSVENEPLPPLEVQGWINTDEPITREDLLGDVVVIDCFFTTCGPCRQKAPEIVRDYLRWRKEGVRYIGLTFEEANMLPEIEAFAEQYGTRWPIAYGAAPTLEELGVYAYPTLIIVGRDGTIRWDSHRRRGTFGRAIRDALAEEQPAEPIASQEAAQAGDAPQEESKGTGAPHDESQPSEPAEETTKGKPEASARSSSSFPLDTRCGLSSSSRNPPSRHPRQKRPSRSFAFPTVRFEAPTRLVISFPLNVGMPSVT